MDHTARGNGGQRRTFLSVQRRERRHLPGREEEREGEGERAEGGPLMGALWPSPPSAGSTGGAGRHRGRQHRPTGPRFRGLTGGPLMMPRPGSLWRLLDQELREYIPPSHPVRSRLRRKRKRRGEACSRLPVHGLVRYRLTVRPSVSLSIAGLRGCWSREQRALPGRTDASSPLT